MKIKNIKLVNQLESYYGIGRTQSKAICNLLGISPLLKMNQLTRYEKVKIRSFMRKRNKIIENPLSSISSMYSQNRSNRKM
jgi:ribosomal protein S13